MEMFKAFIFVFALLGFALVLAHAQDQTDFISLDCGLPRNESYSEPSTGLNYISDAPFIKTGVSKTIAPEYKAFTQEQVAYLRSFPEGIRNCYTINVTKETRYLIRATFFHGNYDGQNIAPKFDLHFGASLWDTVEFFNVSVNTIKEIIHVSLQDYVRVCLVNTGSGTPFISALELRPLLNNTYVIPSGSLALSMRVDMGRSIDDIRVYRYPFDVFDRLWLPFNNDNEWKKLTTSLDMSSGENYKLPSVVMKTASTPMNGSTRMDIYWDTSKKDLIGKEFYMYMHFAELQELKTNQSRAFNITFNGKLWYNSPVVPMSSQVTTISSLSSSISTDNGKYNYSLIKLENSTLPPLINALEIYSLVDFSQSETDQNEVAAIANIKLNYGVKRNWDGDPCVPVSYMWEGLNCSNDGFGLPKITSMNLSSSGLTGEITSYLSKLTMIVSLDLSNNSLTGSVPGFLSQLPNLKVLNLERNKLTGSVPVELIERSKNGLLSLSVGQNPNLCASLSCKKKKNSLLMPILASSGGVVILFIAVAFLVGLITNKRGSRNNQKDPFESKKRQFTHSELIKITNNFEKKLGEGGGGEVYRGSIDASTNVAVKIIRRPLAQGNNQLSQDEKMKKEKAEKEAYQLFQAEACIHH
ncbi:Mitogen-activated protein kinase kinase kinase [Trema orientale]|uniref:Mitogen-activated protein kinase kinase kinase n=1 Tax=Trema orientale TaxID=63057 RepID=A0A2P5BQC8_TREOI|nr:Mitogen-activated protein kinase kinase kinase [Trema orientale]